MLTFFQLSKSSQKVVGLSNINSPHKNIAVPAIMNFIYLHSLRQFQVYSAGLLIVNCKKSSSATSDRVIKPATKGKYVIPKTNGPSDITTATYKMFFALIAVRTLPFIQKTSSNTKIKQVIMAVRKGAKFA